MPPLAVPLTLRRRRYQRTVRRRSPRILLRIVGEVRRPTSVFLDCGAEPPGQNVADPPAMHELVALRGSAQSIAAAGGPNQRASASSSPDRVPSPTRGNMTVGPDQHGHGSVDVAITGSSQAPSHEASTTCMRYRHGPMSTLRVWRRDAAKVS